MTATSTLNLPLLNDVLAWLEAPAPLPGLPTLNMATYVAAANDDSISVTDTTEPNWCGTTACIAGFVCAKLHPRETWHTLRLELEEEDRIATTEVELITLDETSENYGYVLDFEGVAGEALGLDYDQIGYLFYGGFSTKPKTDIRWLEEITPAEAAAAIRNIIAVRSVAA